MRIQILYMLTNFFILPQYLVSPSYPFLNVTDMPTINKWLLSQKKKKHEAMKTIILCGLNSKVQTTTMPYSTIVYHKFFIFYLVNYCLFQIYFHMSCCSPKPLWIFFALFTNLCNLLVEYEFIHGYNFFLILMLQNYYL
jgi:hypothetical protein